MTKYTDVAVIGAGMLGAATARHLQDAGADVTVIGPTGPGTIGPNHLHRTFGAYHDRARITRRLGWDEVWGWFDAQSQERFAEIERRSGTTFFHQCGSLVLMAGSISERTDTILSDTRAKGIHVERLSENQLIERFGALGELPLAGGTEGLYEPDDAGYLDPEGLVAAQLDIAVSEGAKLIRAVVTAVTQSPGGMWRLTLEGPGAEDVVAKELVVATGALTNHIDILPAGIALDMRTFTEPNLLFEVSEDQSELVSTLPAVVTVDPEDTAEANLSLYMLPPIVYPDGRTYIRIGPGMQPIVEELEMVEDLVSWYREQRIAPAQREFLQRARELLVPALEPVSVRESCCVVEKTPTRYPYIGRLESSDITVVVGGNGHGARGSDEIGRLASRVVQGLPWDAVLDEAQFRPRLAPPTRTKVAAGDRPDYLRPPFGLC